MHLNQVTWYRPHINLSVSRSFLPGKCPLPAAVPQMTWHCSTILLSFLWISLLSPSSWKHLATVFSIDQERTSLHWISWGEHHAWREKESPGNWNQLEHTRMWQSHREGRQSLENRIKQASSPGYCSWVSATWDFCVSLSVKLTVWIGDCSGW